MDNILNTKALTDRDLTPVDKLIYVGLASRKDKLGRSTLTEEGLNSMLQVNKGDEVAQLSPERIAEATEKLIRRGYLEQDKFIRLSNKKEDAYGTVVDYVLEYISEARLIRGYATRKLTGEAHRKNILARVKDGATVDECIAVINFRFESDWHKKNNKYLTPSTIFQKSKFEEVLAQIPDILEWSSNQVTKYGISKYSGDTESIGTM